MALTDAKVIQYCYAHLGITKRESGLIEPLILAMAQLTLYDLAKFLVDNDSEAAKNLMTSTAAQPWSASKVDAPADMLYHRQRESTRIEIAGTLLYQIEDKKKLDLLTTGLTNSYYALEGKSFFIKHSSGTTSGANPTIKYLKIPVITDIVDELTNLYLELLFQRLVPSQMPKMEQEK
jgi:hypothetical protein